MKSHVEVLSVLNSIFMPTWFHSSSQIRSKIHENVDPKKLPIMHPFSLRFRTPKTSLLGPNLEPSWPSVSHQDGPRGFPDVPPRGLPDRSWSQLGFQSRHKTAQEASQPPLGAFWARFLGGRGSIFKVFGSHFLHTFELCGLHFSNNLSFMLKHFLH